MPLFANSSAIQTPSRNAACTRRREQPLVLAVLLLSVVVAGLAFFSASGSSAFAAVSSIYADIAPLTVSQNVETGRGARVTELTAEEACRGQAWGRETMTCLSTISRESGTHLIRPTRIIVAGPELQPQTPNVY
ncbi:hypothetical protein NGM99_17660 [Mesorhizobium sp. RP14(2022)]|uniref:Uncharacterized protein n=1 Tax=Mesorhizobium liriopis TaxID=2953882 RepID=A0ABT1C9V1_9HYPH|nr:hypothetical protein [Mesorhizobium liriopis]MCO6051615.1 hypothetical protein [Mesorhizobium liriopis]